MYIRLELKHNENISLTLADTIRSFQKENYYGE